MLSYNSIFATRMERSLRLMSRHDPDLTESRTRGAIAPPLPLLQASTTGAMDWASSRIGFQNPRQSQEASADER
jgi:hypothetical protein